MILHIDMDAFFAAVEQRDDPSLAGRPVVVGADPKGGKGRGVVSTCSYEARRHGIHSAMPISMAYRLCPEALFLPVDMRKYQKVSAEVFDILNDFTPDVEPVSIDEAFLDITGSFHFWGSPLETGREIKMRIKKQLNLTASIGIAPTKMAAKMASDHVKPDGLLEIAPDHLLDFLWPLSIEKMWGVGDHTQKELNAIGIRTIGDLARCPKAMLCKKFGKKGGDFSLLANGVDDRSVETPEEIKSVSHEHTFEVDTKDESAICDVLTSLSEKVSRRLRQSGLKAGRITLKVRFSDFKTITRDQTLRRRTNFFDDICSVSRELFGDVHRKGQEYRLVGVRASHFKDSYVQESLFPDTKSEKMEKIHKAVDSIKDRFGERLITRGRSARSNGAPLPRNTTQADE